MKQNENYCKATDILNVISAEEKKKIKGAVILADANSDNCLENPSFMLWAWLGLSAEHSYLLLPMS